MSRFSDCAGATFCGGVTSLIERYPKLKEHAKEIAKEALEHPAVASPTGRPAAVIGSDELLVILKDLSEGEGNLSPDIKAVLKEQVDAVVPVESRKHAKDLVEEFKTRFPTQSEKMEEAFAALESKMSQMSSDFNVWFDTIMNRTTDRFILYTRIASLIFSVLLAVGLQIDSLDLLKNLSTDSELRYKLIQSADATLSRAEITLYRKPVPVEVLESLKQEVPALKERDIPQYLKTREDGVKWLQNLVGPGPAESEALIKYEARFDELSRTRLQILGKEVQDMKSELEKSKLVVLPATWAEYKNRWDNFFENLLGITISVLLLSLGAPFWFNALRTAATLRPILAGQTDPSKGTPKKK